MIDNTYIEIFGVMVKCFVIGSPHRVRQQKRPAFCRPFLLQFFMIKQLNQVDLIRSTLFLRLHTAWCSHKQVSHLVA